MSADGNWKITIDTPMGAQTLTTAITTSGETFTAKATGPMGDLDFAGAVAGDKLTWSAGITRPMPLTIDFDVTVSGDSMSGTAKLGNFGVAPVKGERA
jgi:hypothetical protein